MWLMVMFDLPVKTKRDKRNYTRFRKHLLNSGFVKIQYSVYARHCADQQKSDKYKRQLKQIIPSHGHVRFMNITDRQFGKTEVYYGKTEHEVETPAPQLMLF